MNRHHSFWTACARLGLTSAPHYRDVMEMTALFTDRMAFAAFKSSDFRSGGVHEAIH
jgi:hypothetical protein